MHTTTITSREFNQYVSRAKKAAKKGPVFITNRNRPLHVLLSIEEYQRIKGEQPNLVDALAMPGLAEIDFQPLRTHVESVPADLC